MSINSKRVADLVISKLQSIDIDNKVGHDESQTAKLVRMIVESVMTELITNGEVIITTATAMTHVGPAKVVGKGKII